MGSCDCSVSTIGVVVPVDLQEFAPDPTIEICPRCFTITTPSAEGPNELSRIDESFPTGDAGVAMALALGFLSDSVALHREKIESLFQYVEDHGVDPWLTLERLAESPTLDQNIDIARIRRQLEQLLE